MPGRIGIDLRHVPLDGPGAGVAHASAELAEALEKYANEYGLKMIPLYEPKRALAFRSVVKNVDRLLVPSGAVPPFMSVPCFPWVHDVEIFDHPEWFNQSGLQRLITTNLFLRGVRQAPHVFAVSENTKTELMRVSGVAAEKITVTYQGIRPIAPGEKKPYALILGSINARKNVEFIKTLWPRVQKQLPTAELIIAGAPYMKFDDRKRDELVREATVLLLPSLHEGFGRTALEAMSAGVPVIASNRGAIPEVVGDAGLLLDPNDSNAWVKGITDAFTGRLDGNPGIERAKLFSWERTARIMLAKMVEF